jgi:hypothetical protein
MHVPMARDEIAKFLETTSANIERVWLNGSLKRSVGDEIRTYSGLARSSIFDVLEYAMSSGDLPAQISPSEAAMWVLYLCEACEWDEWSELSVTKRIENILAISIEDGLIVAEDPQAAITATSLILAHQTLLNICSQNDYEDQFKNVITKIDNFERLIPRPDISNI